jgi:hypothetical protein
METDIPIYEGRLKSLWNQLITLSRNFVHVQWRSLSRSTSLCKRCTSYNAPPTSRKPGSDRWSLRNSMHRSYVFMVGKAQKSHGARSGLYGGCFMGFHRSTFSSPNIEFGDRHRASTKFRLGVIRWVHELCKRHLNTKWSTVQYIYNFQKN